MTLNSDPGQSSRARPRRWCALVVDDEADIRDVTAILLSWAGYEVHTARNSQEAITAATHYLPHLILLDIGMPIVDGYTVCRALRAIPELGETLIYALSGFSGALHEARCLQAGFTGTLTKPVDPDLLRSLG